MARPIEKHEPTKILHVEISETLMKALDRYTKDKGQMKRVAVERLLRKALGASVQQISLFEK